jgi:hypothetical protein
MYKEIIIILLIMSNIINKELEDIKLQYYYCKVSSIKYKKYSDVSNILLLIHQPLVTLSIYNKVCCGRFLPLSTIFPAIHLYLNFQEKHNNYATSSREYYKLYNKYKNKTFSNPDKIYDDLIKEKLIISQNHLK